jgi:hypothetical protein
MRKPARENLRLLRLQQGCKIDWYRIAKQMRSTYPCIDSIDHNFNVRFPTNQAIEWCKDMLPTTQWDQIGHTFIFTTEEQLMWFKMRWIGSENEEIY